MENRTLWTQDSIIDQNQYSLKEGCGDNDDFRVGIPAHDFIYEFLLYNGSVSGINEPVSFNFFYSEPFVEALFNRIGYLIQFKVRFSDIFHKNMNIDDAQFVGVMLCEMK